MGQYEKGVRDYLIDSGITECYPMSSQRDVLRLTTSCHLVAAFYNPDRKINRQAAPNKLYDAMAASRPLLINSEVEISRLVSDEWRCGYAVPFSDTERLTALFNKISLNDDECRIRGKNGRSLFETTYNWEAMECRFSRNGPTALVRLEQRRGFHKFVVVEYDLMRNGSAANTRERAHIWRSLGDLP